MQHDLSKYLLPTDTEERCGLVLKNGKSVEVENTAVDPVTSFEISPAEMIKKGRKVAATWHTHPGQSANLSHEDYAGFLNWPNLTHYIVGTDGVRAYRIQDGLIVCV